MRRYELERRLRNAYRRARARSPRRLLHVLTLPDFDRVGAIQSYWGNPAARTFGEPLIDWEEDLALRAVLVEMREAER